MRYYVFLVVILLLNCKNGKPTKVDVARNSSIDSVKTRSIKKDTIIKKVDNKGFLFVDIWKIFYGSDFALLDKNRDTIISFKNKKAYIEGEEYKMMDEDGFYKKKIKVQSFDPEYGLFILKCLSFSNGFYKVEVNKEVGYVQEEGNRDVLKFKTFEEYVLDSYPIPTKSNPLRVNPNEEASVVNDYLSFTYLSVEIQGDWLKVKDDKNCFIGEEPSKKDIIGWIRWRKDGEIIIKLAQSC